MAGLPCAKEIIDSLGPLAGRIICGVATLAMHAALGRTPSPDIVEKVLYSVKQVDNYLAEAIKEVEP